jgi:SAM-dependent MidA family methyltransferase
MVVPSIDSTPPEVHYTKCFINNEFVDALSRKTFVTINPGSSLRAVTSISTYDMGCS